MRFCSSLSKHIPYHPYKLSQALNTNWNIPNLCCHFHFSVLQVNFHSTIQRVSKQARYLGSILGLQASCTKAQTPLKLATLLYTTQAETGKTMDFYLSIQTWLSLGLWMKHVLLIALKPSMYLLFIYIEYAVRILAMNIEEKLGQKLGMKKLSLVS